MYNLKRKPVTFGYGFALKRKAEPIRFQKKEYHDYKKETRYFKQSL